MVGVLGWLGGLGPGGNETVRADRLPNVLVIYTDEHHFNTLGCYGGTVVQTPHIDSIADAGARCTSFYAATPVCSPSRASILSGNYPQHTGVERNDVPLDPDIVTLGEALRREGYATGWAGKWHLAGKGKPQWAPPEKFGFVENRFMFNRGHWKKLVETATGPRVGSRNRKGQPDYGMAGADEHSYATDWLVGKTIDFIEEHTKQPFCFVTSLPDPHGPNRVRPPYDTQFVGADVSIPPSYFKPRTAVPGWAPRSPKINPRWMRANLPQYYGMVKCIDDNVGRILTVLRRQGRLENTIIVFTSDHGDLCGEHGRSEKGNPYEGSARIPFLLSYPGVVPKGHRIDEALNTTDVLPTLMALIGKPLKHAVDGRDASVLFRGGVPEGWQDVTVFRSTATGGHWVAAASNDFKLVVSNQDRPWLFDLTTDPYEINNRIDWPTYSNIAGKLAEALRDYENQVGDPFLGEEMIRGQLDSLLER